MANGMYNVAKHRMEIAGFDFTDGMWYVQLCDNGYTPNFTTDTTVANFAGHTVGGATAIGGGASSAAGVVSGNSVTVTGVSAGLTVKSVVVYHDTGSATFLAFYFDTGTGFPLTTTGAAITIDWNATITSGNLMTL